MSRPSPLRYLLLAALVQVTWGFTPSASKIVLDHLPVETYSAIRYSVSGLIFLVYTLATRRRLRLHRRDLPGLVLLGVLAYGINSLGTLYGLKVGGVLNFALASSVNAVITAAVAILVLKEKLTRPVLVAAVLSVAGGYFLASGKYDLSSLEVAYGSLLLICGAYVLEALGFVYSKKFKARLPLTEYLAVAQLSAGAFMWGVSASLGQSPSAATAMPWDGRLSLLFVCLISCGVCYFLLYWLLNHVEGSKLAFFDCFHTFSAVAFGAILFEEPFNSKMLLGGLLLVAAVLVVSWQHWRAASRLDGRSAA